MAPRVDLQTLLEQILGSGNVYFQPPSNISMKYDCIVYKRSRIETNFADNKPYGHKKRYEVTLISRNPDNAVVDQIAALPQCSHDRFFTADNLNHDVFTLYF